MDVVKKYTANQLAKALGIAAVTLKSWEKSGIISPSFVSEGGHRYYTEEQFLDIIKKFSKNKKTIGYCRVSESDGQAVLNHRVANLKMFMLGQGNSFDVITDICEETQYTRDGLYRLLEQVANYEVGNIVLLDKSDIFTNGFGLFEHGVNLLGCKITILSDIISNTPNTCI